MNNKIENFNRVNTMVHGTLYTCEGRGWDLILIGILIVGRVNTNFK